MQTRLNRYVNQLKYDILPVMSTVRIEYGDTPLLLNSDTVLS